MSNLATQGEQQAEARSSSATRQARLASQTWIGGQWVLVCAQLADAVDLTGSSQAAPQACTLE